MAAGFRDLLALTLHWHSASLVGISDARLLHTSSTGLNLAHKGTFGVDLEHVGPLGVDLVHECRMEGGDNG